MFDRGIFTPETVRRIEEVKLFLVDECKFEPDVCPELSIYSVEELKENDEYMSKVDCEGLHWAKCEDLFYWAIFWYNEFNVIIRIRTHDDFNACERMDWEKRCDEDWEEMADDEDHGDEVTIDVIHAESKEECNGENLYAHCCSNDADWEDIKNLITDKVKKWQASSIVQPETAAP